MNELCLMVGILVAVAVSPYAAYLIFRFASMGWFSGKRRVLRRKEADRQ
jgi:hypothetical protein